MISERTGDVIIMIFCILTSLAIMYEFINPLTWNWKDAFIFVTFAVIVNVIVALLEEL